MKIFRTVAGMVAAAAIVGATVPAASAASYSTNDPLYDQKSTAKAPSTAIKAQVDMKKTSSFTTSTRMYFRVSMRDLSTSVKLPEILVMENRPSTQFRYQVYFNGSQVQLLAGTGTTGSEKCAGQGWVGKDYTNNFVQVSYPKGCFAKGHVWVKPIFRTLFDNGSSTYHVQVVDWNYAGYNITPNP